MFAVQMKINVVPDFDLILLDFGLFIPVWQPVKWIIDGPHLWVEWVLDIEFFLSQIVLHKANKA